MVRYTKSLLAAAGLAVAFNGAAVAETKVAVIMSDSGSANPFWAAVTKGALDKGAELGIDVAAVAPAGGETDVAGQIGSSSNAAADRMSHMANAGYLARASVGNYQISGLVPLSVVLQEGQYHELAAPTSSDVADGSAVPARCNRWMPRARARCALAAGHAGRCRSR